ncbi:MAG TPA: tetrahydromethanopterin S-methyltransferase subunit H, partial [Candidatus Altiarchaeales archaeon]|nr:tetrahydromethanopterin S-methyltransferase subunit H [Candidatus Altiarchaeales archaeon]
SWEWMREEKAGDKTAYSHCSTAANALIPFATGDFAFYGSIEKMNEVIPPTAFVDRIIAEGSADYFGISPAKNHPHNNL